MKVKVYHINHLKMNILNTKIKINKDYNLFDIFDNIVLNKFFPFCIFDNYKKILYDYDYNWINDWINTFNNPNYIYFKYIKQKNFPKKILETYYYNIRIYIFNNNLYIDIQANLNINDIDNVINSLFSVLNINDNYDVVDNTEKGYSSFINNDGYILNVPLFTHIIMNDPVINHICVINEKNQSSKKNQQNTTISIKFVRYPSIKLSIENKIIEGNEKNTYLLKYGKNTSYINIIINSCNDIPTLNIVLTLLSKILFIYLFQTNSPSYSDNILFKLYSKYNKHFKIIKPLKPSKVTELDTRKIINKISEPPSFARVCQPKERIPKVTHLTNDYIETEDYLYKNIKKDDKNIYLLYPKDNINDEQYIYYCNNQNTKGTKTWSNIGILLDKK